MKQGDVYLVNLDPVVRTEIGKIWPGIILSINAMNRFTRHKSKMAYIDSIYIVLAIVFSAFILYQESLYRVKGGDQVVIDTLGELTAKTAPGTYLKIPFIQKTHFYPKSAHHSKTEHEISTLNKKLVRLNTQIIWKLDDPIKFYNRLYYFDKNSKSFVESIIRSAERAIINNTNLKNIVFESNDSTDEDKQCHPEVIQKIKQEAQKGLKEYGILLLKVDVKVSVPH